ncbi:Nucleotide-binding universal stress protein, UspA family [Flavobacterium micromati]|uniref:Nucleotide-binding universal stress protein, UspA family n=1 Tax=Flavobacterium micromati TaxID=229205 RepID=A0A1M5FI39_9FLAO|nr:universal stress protein [Flavobacterium micromati]SHF91165.1 Nucleotide-binding universal stress protein, UspA family [Flavobacterium micromati]
MKRILVPIDFSQYAENALKTAAIIARKNNSEIFILHLLELPSQMQDALSDGNSIPEVMLFIKKANEKITKITEQSYLDDVIIHVMVRFEKAFSGILAFVENNQIDLIVMGSHGTSGIEDILIGSNAEKVVRLSNIPVLVIKKNPDSFKPDNFVFASDFSKEIKKPFKKMLRFVEIFDAKLYLVMICSPNSFKTTLESEKTMNKFVKKHNIKNHSLHIFNDTNIENGIINFAQHVNADLIGICTHGRTGLAHFFNGSISEDIVNHSSKPVITFRISG